MHIISLLACARNRCGDIEGATELLRLVGDEWRCDGFPQLDLKCLCEVAFQGRNWLLGGMMLRRMGQNAANDAKQLEDFSTTLSVATADWPPQLMTQPRSFTPETLQEELSQPFADPRFRECPGI